MPTLYKVYYQDAEDSSSSLQVSSITSPPAIITNLQPNTLYEFYVIPFNGAVAGLKSSVTKVRTLEEGNLRLFQKIFVKNFYVQLRELPYLEAKSVLHTLKDTRSCTF